MVGPVSAFIAGVISFIAPCVLPLVPGYLSAVSHVDADRLGAGRVTPRVFLSSFPFVCGFSSVFVALGALAGQIGSTIGQRSLREIAGFVVIVTGLAFLGALPVPDRLFLPAIVTQARSSGSGLALGAAFAVCATPCVGPILGATLALASSTSTAAHAAILLLAYSLGLAIPFVVCGIAFSRVIGGFRAARNHYRMIRVLSGLCLIAVGTLLFLDRYWWLQAGLNRALNVFGLGV